MIAFAKKEDSLILAHILIDAMGEIAYTLANTKNYDEMVKKIAFFISSTNNRLSYENILVDYEGDKIRGALLFYPSKDSVKLDKFILSQNGLTKPFENESPDNGLYIDSVATALEFRGKGVAKTLINELKNIAKKRRYKKIWLIAEDKKPHLLGYYNALGFELFNKMQLQGATYSNMYYEVKR